MLESSSLRYFVLTFPRHSIVPEKTTHLEFFFHMRYGGKMFYYAPPVVSKSFFNHLLGPRHWCRTRPFVFSFFFPPAALRPSYNIVSARRKRDINPQKNFSIFRTPAPGHAAIYSSRAHPSRTKQYKMRTYKKGTSIFW